MEKTLRELCETYRDAWDESDKVGVNDPRYPALRHTASGTFAELQYRGLDATHGEAMESTVRAVLAAIYEERAAVLEEVREWLEERAGELERQLAADHHDSHKHGGADEVRVLTYRFTRRFLAGKEGA